MPLDTKRYQLKRDLLRPKPLKIKRFKFQIKENISLSSLIFG